MYTVTQHAGVFSAKYDVRASDGTLLAVFELRGEAQMVTDTLMVTNMLNETDKRLVDALAEVSRLRSERDVDRLLAVAERSAKAMRWECVKVAENYLTGVKARHIAGAMDLLDAPAVARRAAAEQEKP